MRSSKIAGLVLALGLFSVSAAVAQQPARQDSAAHRNHKQQFQGRGRQGGGMGFLLKGIDLTADQKTQLKALRSKQGDKMYGQDFDREALKTARERGDTAALRQFRVKHAAAMKQNREQQFAQIRSILTPAQQTIFDRNVADAKARFEKHRKRGEGKHRHQS